MERFSLEVTECKERTVVDYHAPLERMRPASNVPTNRLPFGPDGLQLDFGRSAILDHVAAVQFLLADGTGDSPRRISYRGWVAESSLTVVRRGGASIRTVAEKRQKLTRLLGDKSGMIAVGRFRVPPTVGFYRLSIQFRRNGMRSDRYQSYFRVVPPRLDLRLALSASSLSTPATLTWRLENFGTSSVIFGLKYRLERYDGSRWVVDPVSPVGFPQVGFIIGPGAAGGCQSLQLLAGMESGRYRIAKTVGIGGSGVREVAAEFRIG